MLVQRRVGEAIPDYGVESAGVDEKKAAASAQIVPAVANEASATAKKAAAPGLFPSSSVQIAPAVAKKSVSADTFFVGIGLESVGDDAFFISQQSEKRHA